MLQRLIKRASNVKTTINQTYYHKKVERVLKQDSLKIYHLHIRKTGGSTINHAFIRALGSGRVEKDYETIATAPEKPHILGNHVIAGWGLSPIRNGLFHYAFSHTPLHQLSLPNDCFTITCLRDPVKRVLSHFNMLKHFHKSGIDHPCMKEEGPWAQGTLHDFLDQLPKYKLLNQLYMFSENYEVEHALEQIHNCAFTMITENLDQNLADLSALVSINLISSRKKHYGHQEPVRNSEMDRLREMLELEYDLLRNFFSSKEIS